MSSTAKAASTAKARNLRRSMSEPEVMLWARLKRLRPLGYHLRRQTPLGPYFPDFLCKPAMLVIEVDGAQHLTPTGHAHDIARDAWLAGQGYETLRFHASDIIADADDVCRQILDRLKQKHPSPNLPAPRHSPPGPLHAPPSPKGEGK